MKTIIKQALDNAMTFVQYKEFFEKLVLEGKTTGPNQTEGYVSFTKLNLSRFHRAAKFIELSQPTVNKLAELSEPLTLLVITEAWCGDASQILPVIEKMEQAASNLTVKLVLRDENEELMNLFLTNGSKSIPKVIVLDKNLEVLHSWGPRPAKIQEKVVAFKAENPSATSMDVSNMVQKIYNEDKGAFIQEDLIEILSEVCCA